MAFFGGASSSALATSVSALAAKDIEVADPPTDSISSISFSSVADYLAVGSWDNNVRLWCLTFIYIDTLLNCSHIGPHLRGWSKWADARKGHVLASRACVERLLEQGVFLPIYCAVVVSLTLASGRE
jgi:WD40 repeat protein